MNWQGLLALLAALGALGTSSYYISDGVTGGETNAVAPIEASTNAAAALEEQSTLSASGVRCGVARWDVKTLTDDEASKVNLTPVQSDITSLASIAAPKVTEHLPRQSQERNVYTVTGSIIGFKREDDGDIHLALQDPNHQDVSMIAEFPNAGCVHGAVDEAAIDQARQGFEQAFGQATRKLQTPTGCVTITGVFFFDEIHGQIGVARNGAELHPAIGFQKASGCETGTPTTSTASTTTTTAPASTTTGPTPASCSYRDGGALPDPQCTPGALNPDVTPSTIDSTICKKAWTATVRPPASVTGPEKLASMKQYGVGDQSPGAFEYDHLISLELGGAPNDLSNLWPEPHDVSGDEGSFAKDKVENRLKREICAGSITLAQAQHQIATDWRKAP